MNPPGDLFSTEIVDPTEWLYDLAQARTRAAPIASMVSPFLPGGGPPGAHFSAFLEQEELRGPRPTSAFPRSVHRRHCEDRMSAS